MKRIIELLHRLLGVIVLIMFVMMVFAILWQVFARFVLNAAPVWTEEFSRYILVWITLLGSAYLVKNVSGHISVNILVDLLPEPARIILAKIRDVVIILVAGALVYVGLLHALIGQRRISTGLNVTMDIPYYAIPVGAALILVFAFFRLAGNGAGKQ